MKMLAVLVLMGGLASAQEVRRAHPVPREGVPTVQAPSVIVSPEPEIRRADPVPSRADNELARFLVGVRLPPESPLAELQETAEYGEHSSSLARLWRHYNENYFMPMRLWSEITLSTRIQTELPLIYFFGGPDAINAMALFPEARVYVLGGLEPVGQVISPAAIDSRELGGALISLRQSLEVALSYGHFITKDMKEDLERSAFRGVLPLFLAFVALSGGEVLETSYIGITPGGGLQEFGNHYAGTPGTLPGVKVTFVRSEGARPQAIVYVQANVADGPLKSNPALIEWVQKFGAANSYLKAASYLMHEPGFSRVRKFLLDQSEAILQDDSGIPLSAFSPEKWKLEFFGAYSGTLDIFKKYYQPALLEIFLTQPISPLPFGTGYKWRQGESNLLLATKAAPATTVEDLNPPED